MAGLRIAHEAMQAASHAAQLAHMERYEPGNQSSPERAERANQEADKARDNEWRARSELQACAFEASELLEGHILGVYGLSTQE